MKYFVLLLVLLFTACREIPVDKEDLLGYDVRLFQGTIAWELAKAVDDEDVAEIKHQIKDLKIPVDYKEEKFGETLLMFAVCHKKYNSVKTLLELGADPNEPNDTVHNYGKNSVILASEFSRSSASILKLLLAHGGNPNSITRGVQQDMEGNYRPVRYFALYTAAPEDIEKVIILVQAGADVNMQTEDTGAGAMEAAIVHNRMDVLLYLLTHGADFHRKFKRQDFSTPSPAYYDVDILHMLRLSIYPLDSKEYKWKLKVIKFLQRKGLDYWKSPISDDMIKIIKRDMNIKNEEELQKYLEKY